MDIFNYLLSQFGLIGDHLVSNATAFWLVMTREFGLLGIVDIVLVFWLLYWIYRRLYKSDIIKIFPRLVLLLLVLLLAQLAGLTALAYLAGSLFVISLLSVASLYAPDIKNLLEVALPKATHDHRPHPHTIADTQTMVSSISEAMAVLTRSEKSALIIIKHDRAVSRLVTNGTRMDTKIRAELLIDFFSSGSVLSKGAVVVEGDRIVAAGSSLWRPQAKVLFHTTNPDIVKVAQDMGAVVVVYSKALAGISLLYRDQIYGGLTPPELKRQLQNILVFQPHR